MFIEDLPQQMEENFKQYEGEFGKSKPSIVFNFMFVEFATCGISGDHDFEQLNITWNKISSKIFKQSCCSNNSMKWEVTKAQSFFTAFLLPYRKFPGGQLWYHTKALCVSCIPKKKRFPGRFDDLELDNNEFEPNLVYILFSRVMNLMNFLAPI